MIDRAARTSVGPLAAVRAAVLDALATREQTVENTSDAAVVVQEWPVGAHSILAVVDGGADAAIRRAIETHRGMGVGTITAITGGAADDSALDAISNGSIEWDGTTYTGLDLSGAGTATAKAAALDSLLPASVSIRYIGGRYVAVYRWTPASTPGFDDGAVATAFGLDPDGSEASPGPFVRPVSRSLTVELTATRQAVFPADGLDQIRAALLAVPTRYGLGEEVWLNDFLVAAESVLGTRVSVISVQADGADVSGVAAPLDNRWTLDIADVTITI